MNVPALLSAIALASLAAVALVACGEEDDVARNDPEERRGSGEAGASRIAKVDTSTLLLPLARRAGDVVDRRPGAGVEVEVSGSGEALAALCARKTDVALTNRRLSEAERQVCARNGVSPIRSLVAYQVVALYASRGLGFRCLTVDQLGDLWRPGSRVERYSELGPALPEHSVRLIAYPPDSASYEFFARRVAGGARVLRKEVRTVADRLRFWPEVRSTERSLGLGPYARSPGEGLMLVAVDGGRGCVRPSAETVQSGAYRPLSAPLFMYSTRRALEKAAVKGFADHVLDNPREVADYRGVVPPDAAEQPEAEPR